MTHPYSTRFFAQLLNTSRTNAVYVVPAGFRAIVKQLIVFSAPGAPQTLTMQAVVSSGTVWLYQANISTPTFAVTDYHQVFYAGDRIEAYVSSGEASAIMSGYLLTE